MGRRVAGWLLAMAALCVVHATPRPARADAADGVVAMTRPHPVAPDIAAMPRIAAPATGAERRINAALGRLDAAVRAAASSCRREARAVAAPDAPSDAAWTRAVTVTMAGPRYLSLVIADDAFCGGAHPNATTMAIVYDLRTGAPVDWTRLLPAALTGRVALARGMDGTRMVTLDSARLHELYLKGYGATELGTDPQCLDAVSAPNGQASAPSMVWLDAARGGLAVQFDLAHVVQSCANPVVIPAATLRAEGADPGLVAAIEAARRAR